MASTLTPTQADPRFDSDPAPTVAEGRFTDVEEALARLAHRAASDAPDARPSGSDRSADARMSPSSAAAAFGPADVRAPVPREQQPLGKRGTLAWAAIAVCLGACSIWAWQLYGGPARDLIATWAPSRSISARPAPPTPDPAPEQAAAPAAVETSVPSPAQAASQATPTAQPATTANEPASADRQQIETIGRDLAALRQTVEQLSANQEQLSRELAKLRAEKPQADKPPADKPDKRLPHRVSAPAVPAVAAPARKPPTTPMPPPISSMPPQAAPQLSTVSPLPPPPQPPQIQSDPHPADPPPFRPPMPVPQP